MKRKLFIPLILLVFLVIGCASLQAQWNAKTPDEQARIILNGLQKQIDNALDLSIAYVNANPQYKDRWKAEVLPAFNLANQAIKIAIIYKKDSTQIYTEVLPLLQKALALARGIGVKI